eukprot:4843040-Amphidinium_carterae.1
MRHTNVHTLIGAAVAVRGHHLKKKNSDAKRNHGNSWQLALCHGQIYDLQNIDTMNHEVWVPPWPCCDC